MHCTPTNPNSLPCGVRFPSHVLLPMGTLTTTEPTPLLAVAFAPSSTNKQDAEIFLFQSLSCRKQPLSCSWSGISRGADIRTKSFLLQRCKAVTSSREAMGNNWNYWVFFLPALLLNKQSTFASPRSQSLRSATKLNRG